MSPLGKGLLASALTLPLVAFVAGVLASPDTVDPDRSRPVIIGRITDDQTPVTSTRERPRKDTRKNDDPPGPENARRDGPRDDLGDDNAPREDPGDDDDVPRDDPDDDSGEAPDDDVTEDRPYTVVTPPPRDLDDDDDGGDDGDDDNSNGGGGGGGSRGSGGSRDD